MSDNKNESPLSILKHAEFMLRLAEKLILIAFTGLVGTPAVQMVTAKTPIVPWPDVFGVYLWSMGIAGTIGVAFMIYALKRYTEASRLFVTNTPVSGMGSGNEPLTGPDAPLCLSIDHHQTKISIRVEGNP